MKKILMALVAMPLLVSTAFAEQLSDRQMDRVTAGYYGGGPVVTYCPCVGVGYYGLGLGVGYYGLGLGVGYYGPGLSLGYYGLGLGLGYYGLPYGYGLGGLRPL